MRTSYFGLSVVAFGLLLHEYAYKDFLIDDAFISFRYAENLATGYGLVFNRTGNPVEGYTNFLWTFLFAGIAYLKLDPVATSKIFGCLLSLLSLGLTYRVSRIILLSETQHSALSTQHSGPEGWTLLPPVFLATSGSFAAWAMGGLETHLVTALNLLALQRYFTAHFLSSSIFFTLASLTRPDAILLWGAAWLLHLTLKREVENKKQKKESHLLFSFSLFALPLSPFLFFWVPAVGFGLFWIWRWQYYGDFLPNTYYMKTGGGWFQVLTGVSYVFNYILSQGGFFPFLLFYFFRWELRTGLSRFHLLLLTQIGFYLIFIVTSGGDWMPLHRFMVPLLPLLAILNTVALKRIHEKLTLFLEKMNSGSSIGKTIPLYLLISLFLIFPLIETLVGHPSIMEDSEGVQSLVEFGKWLGNQVPPGSLIAVNPAGAIPYYSRLNTLDMTGLTDSHIAHLRMGGLHQKYDSAYVLSRHPDFIVLIGRYNPKTRSYQATWIGEEDLFHKEEFQALYQLRDNPVFKYKKEYQIILFQRKG